MLSATDINAQSPNIQPYVLVDTNGTTIYTGTSISFNDAGAAVWRIKKQYVSGNVTIIGYAEGSQEFTFVWNNRVGYNYK
jgi:hypothetical protein